MRIFEPITSIVARWRSKEEPKPFVSDGDLAKLRTLRASDEYATFLRLVDAHVSLNAESLLHPTATDASVHFCRGKVAGLRSAALLVDEILAHHDASERTKQQRSLAAGDSDGATAFGSPFWRSGASATR